MERWTRTIIRRRRIVLAAWLAIFAASLVAMSGLSDLLTNRFAMPGTDTAKAEAILEDHFGQKTTGSFTVVARTAPGEAQGLLPQVRDAAARASEELPTSRLAGVQLVSDSVISATIVSNLEPAEAKGHTDDMRAAAGTVPGAELFVSGQAAIEHDLDPVFAHDLQVGELFIAIPIATLILVFVFGTLAFLVPLIFAMAAIPATLGILWIFANFLELTTYLQNLVMLIGLGIAVDYSLLVVYRYREELSESRAAAAPAGRSPAPPPPAAAAGTVPSGAVPSTVPSGPAPAAAAREHERRANGSKEDAIVRTMRTAGRAVVFSGTAVAIGLALMLFMPLPFLRGFGLGGLLIPLVSVVCALTLLPVLLYWLAAPLDRVHLIPRRIVERRDGDANMWWRLAHAIMRRPATFAAVTIVALLALATPTLALQLGPGSNDGVPQDLEGVQGLNIVSAAIGDGALAPSAIVVDTGREGGASDPAVEAAVGRLVTGLEADPEVAAVRFEDSPQHVDATRRYLNVEAIGKSEYGKPASLDFVDRLRDDIVPGAGFPRGTEVVAGGGPASGVDFIDLTYSAFPWLVIGVLVLTYFLLMRAFRSLLLPLKAILLNLLSIGAAYGLLVLFFKFGLAESVGLIGFDQVEAWIPIFIFAMVFGLSMDYEVFLVSRMREEWDAGRSNEDAVAVGLAKTGRIVTAAGLIMFAAFMGFVAGSIVGLQQFGFGLAMAILLDVTIVRALLVPSMMKLFGRWNWWLPERVARVARVPASPLAETPAVPSPAS
jgi:RND superfamily putative drug exporter